MILQVNCDMRYFDLLFVKVKKWRYNPDTLIGNLVYAGDRSFVVTQKEVSIIKEIIWNNL